MNQIFPIFLICLFIFSCVARENQHSTTNRNIVTASEALKPRYHEVETSIELPSLKKPDFWQIEFCPQDRKCTIHMSEDNTISLPPIKAKASFRICRTTDIKDNPFQIQCEPIYGDFDLEASELKNFVSLMLAEQFELENALDQKYIEIFPLLKHVHENLQSCSEIIDPSFQDFLKELEKWVSLSPLEFAKRSRLLDSSQLRSWLHIKLQESALKADVDQLKEEVKKLSDYQIQDDQFAKIETILEIPLLFIGAGTIAYEIKELSSWYNYLRSARTVIINGQPVILKRHESGFMVHPDDVKKDLQSIKNLYFDDPVTKKVLVNHQGQPIKIKWDIDKYKIRYQMGKWRNSEGIKILLKRQADGSLDLKPLPSNPSVYEISFEDRFYRVLPDKGLVRDNFSLNQRQLFELKLEYEMKLNNLYHHPADPTFGGKMDRALKGAAPYVTIAGGIFATLIGIAGLIEAFHLSKPECDDLHKLIFAIKKLYEEADLIMYQLLDVKFKIAASDI